MIPRISEGFPLGKIETVAVLKRLAGVSRRLAELKGVGGTIPRPGILINTLAMQEAKDSSEIENIVATQDEIYRGDLFLEVASTPAAKEVQRYATAMRVGYDSVRSTGLLTANHILEIQSVLKESGAGLRKLPGTVLKDAAGAVVYTPPPGPRGDRRADDRSRAVHQRSRLSPRGPADQDGGDPPPV